MTRRTDSEAVLKSLRRGVAAKLLGIDPKTLDGLNCPRNEDRTYDGFKLVPWYVAEIRRKHRERTREPIDPLDRKRLADAKLAELKLAEAEGRYIPIEMVNCIFEKVAAHLRKSAEIIQRVNLDCYEVLLQGLDDAATEFAAQYGQDRPDSYAVGKPTR